MSTKTADESPGTSPDHASRKLRVGIIGTGFGTRVHLPAFAANQRVQVAALCSGQPGKARALADRLGVPLAFDDYEDLVRADLDLVSVAAPPHLHRQMVLAAVAAGRHVLCEKPLALSTAEAAEMLAAAEARGVLHVVDHEVRFNPNRRKLRRLIADGYIGQPRHALVTVIRPTQSDPSRRFSWWHQRALGGGALGAYGSHQIDLLRYLLGEVEPGSATGTLATFVRERLDLQGQRRQVDVDDFATFTLRMSSGAICVVLVSGVAPRQQGPLLEIWGDQGSLMLDEDERLRGVRQGGPAQDLSEPETAAMPPGMDYDRLWGSSFALLADHLAAVILDGAPVAPAATFRDGLAVQRTLDEIRLAARSV